MLYKIVKKCLKPLHNVMVFDLNELDEDDVHDAEDEG